MVGGSLWGLDSVRLHWNDVLFHLMIDVVDVAMLYMVTSFFFQKRN